MRATINLGGKGTYDNNALESADRLSGLLSEEFEGIDFSMRTASEIDCEFADVSEAELRLLGYILGKGNVPAEIESFMADKSLRFEKITFESGWEDRT